MTAGHLPTVTVVIPCFNQARYLGAALSSVLNQTHRPLECIVVDDGSTDDTAGIAAGLGARVITQANQGVSAARNAGLRAARGDMVVFLDADDVLLPGALAMEAAALCANGRAAAVVTRCEAMNEDGMSMAVAHHRIDPSNLYREWLSRNFVWTPGAAMFRRTALAAEGGFAEDLGAAADYAIYLRLARDGRVAFISGCAVRYRQHALSMSRDPALMLRATLQALRRERREGPAWVRGEIRRGRRTWCAWYGEQIVHDLRAHWHAGAFGYKQVQALLTLVWSCPTLVLRHVARKTRHSVLSALRSASAHGRAAR
jgi:cellulose synthase/poly-beta-1,6-N-acetylglucosamine synthase-like glycosyltransferase